MEGFPCGPTVNESACNAGDLGSVPGLARFPGEGKIYPLWYRSWMGELFSRSVMSDSLRPHGLQHTRLPCPSGACSNSCPSSQWCHPTISSSVVPFSSCLQSFPESGSFLISQFFASGGQSIGASASASVLPVNIELIFFRINWFDLLVAQGTLNSLLQYYILKASILWLLVFETRETGDTEKEYFSQF